jgi:hypothetical protein
VQRRDSNSMNLLSVPRSGHQSVLMVGERILLAWWKFFKEVFTTT